tara:strand:+ start:201 stop:353 length:153 start_codon:yes stop_codon:yes gene_type:complete
MNSNLNSTVQFSNDTDLLAYRGMAAELRSKAIRHLFSQIASRLHLTSAKS